jgi:hypothetical protein
MNRGEGSEFFGFCGRFGHFARLSSLAFAVNRWALAWFPPRMTNQISHAAPNPLTQLMPALDLILVGANVWVDRAEPFRE